MFIITALKLGIILSIMTLGVHVTFRIMDTPDLSIEGTFPLGGCVTALLITLGLSPFVSTIIAILAGALAGLLTGILHTKLKIPMILSGIITLTALFAINMMILGLSENSFVMSQQDIELSNTIFYPIRVLLINMGLSVKWSQALSVLIVSIIVLALVFSFIYFFFGTELGMSIRSTGDNKGMSRAQGINTDFTTILGLAISNGLIALAASLFVQNSNVVYVTDGVGKIVVGLSSIIIGETIFGRKSYKSQLISIIVGTLIYYVIEALVIKLFSDIGQIRELFSAITLTIFLVIPLIKKQIKSKKNTRKREQNA